MASIDFVVPVGGVVLAAVAVQQTLAVNALKAQLASLEGPPRGNATVAVVDPSTVAAMDTRMSSLEASINELQVSDKQNLELQKLLVGDVSSLKAAVTQVSTDMAASATQQRSLQQQPLQMDPRVNDLERKVDELSSLVKEDAALLKEAVTNLSLDLDDSVEQMQSKLESRIEAITQQRVRDVYDRVAQLSTKVDTVAARGEQAAVQAAAVAGRVDRVAAESRELATKMGQVSAKATAQTTELATKMSRAEQQAAARAAVVSGAVADLAGKVGAAEARVAAVSGQVETTVTAAVSTARETIRGDVDATLGAAEDRATRRMQVLATRAPI